MENTETPVWERTLLDKRWHIAEFDLRPDWHTLVEIMIRNTAYGVDAELRMTIRYLEMPAIEETVLYPEFLYTGTGDSPLKNVIKVPGGKSFAITGGDAAVFLKSLLQGPVTVKCMDLEFDLPKLEDTDGQPVLEWLESSQQDEDDDDDFY